MTLIEQPDQVVLDKDYKGEKKINVGKCQQTSEVQGLGKDQNVNYFKTQSYI